MHVQRSSNCIAYPVIIWYLSVVKCGMSNDFIGYFDTTLIILFLYIILYHRQTDDDNDIELYQNITETNHRFLALIAYKY